MNVKKKLRYFFVLHYNKTFFSKIVYIYYKMIHSKWSYCKIGDFRVFIFFVILRRISFFGLA